MKAKLLDNKQRTPLYFSLFRNPQAESCDLAVAEQIIKLKAKHQNINEEFHKCMKLHFSLGGANGQWIEEYYGGLHFPDENAALIVEELPAIYLALRIGRQDIAELIQRHSQGIPGTAINKGGPKTGRNALHWATIKGELDVVRQLCMGDGFLKGNVEDLQGKTTLEYARDMRHKLIEIMQASLYCPLFLDTKLT
ncbi:hypothetical protein GOP47_0009917 [Adiantum capillus-veneris]|uniref:Ankyrin repeat domain-containing protein n=1 Tax=Adiantum capillus-veneris TaxID=13818 RepID=A0A9D4UXH4_ADICA|nr:hypothetical protein GOP47_0009917 [Adiantum capillus-veneris]